MSSLSQRLRTFVTGPTGRRLLEQGQRQLAKPENKEKIQRLMARRQGKKR